MLPEYFTGVTKNINIDFHHIFTGKVESSSDDFDRMLAMQGNVSNCII